MKKAILIAFWIVLIFILNLFGRYLYVEFFEGGYNWLNHFYIEVAGSIGTIVTIILFFIVNYIINKKREKHYTYSFTKTRLLIMIVSIILAFIGEQIYLFISDYFLFKT